MLVRSLLIPGALMLASVAGGNASADEMQGRYVRVAEIEVDPVQLDKYKTALRDEIEASVRIEPGVIALYSMSDKENPSRIRILEIYADMAAYRAHIETPHFKKYKVETQDMVKALKLVDVDPILFGGKAR